MLVLVEEHSQSALLEFEQIPRGQIVLLKCVLEMSFNSDRRRVG